MSAPTLYIWNLPSDINELDILAAFSNLKLTSVRFGRQSIAAATDDDPMANLQQATICFPSEDQLLLANERPSIKGVPYILSSVPYSAGAKGQVTAAAAANGPDLLDEYMAYMEDTDGQNEVPEPAPGDTTLPDEPALDGIPVPREPPFVVYFPHNAEPIPFGKFAAFANPFETVGCQLPNPLTGDPAAITFATREDMVQFLGRSDWDVGTVRLRPCLTKKTPSAAEVGVKPEAQLIEAEKSKEQTPAAALEAVVTKPTVVKAESAMVDSKLNDATAINTDLAQPNVASNANYAVLLTAGSQPDTQIPAENAINKENPDNSLQPEAAAAKPAVLLNAFLIPDTRSRRSRARLVNAIAKENPANSVLPEAAVAVAAKPATIAIAGESKIRIVQPANAAAVPHYPPYVLYIHGLEANTDLFQLVDKAAMTRHIRYGPQLECARIEFALRDDLVRIVSKDGIWLGDRRIEMSLTELSGITAPVTKPQQPSSQANKQPSPQANKQPPRTGEQPVEAVADQRNQIMPYRVDSNSPNMRRPVLPDSLWPVSPSRPWQMSSPSQMDQQLNPHLLRPDLRTQRLQVAGRCGFCEQLAEMMCSSCRAVYCSPRCQHTDWPHHSRICRPIPMLLPIEMRTQLFPKPPPNNVMPDVNAFNALYSTYNELGTNNNTGARFIPSDGMNDQQFRTHSNGRFSNGSIQNGSLYQSAAVVSAAAVPAAAVPVAVKAAAAVPAAVKAAAAVPAAVKAAAAAVPAKLPEAKRENPKPAAAPNSTPIINNPFKKKPTENIILGDDHKKAYSHPNKPLHPFNAAPKPASNNPNKSLSPRTSAHIAALDELRKTATAPPPMAAPIAALDALGPAATASAPTVIRPVARLGVPTTAAATAPVKVPVTVPITAPVKAPVTPPLKAPANSPVPVIPAVPPPSPIAPINYRPMRRERIDVPYCEMPASGSTVSITEVIAANTCFVRNNSPLFNREYGNVLEQIASYAHQKAQPVREMPVIGQVILARHPRLECWARVLVLRVLPAPGTDAKEPATTMTGAMVLLAFIDYGHMATLALAECRELAAQLQQLMRYVHRVRVQVTGDGAEPLGKLCGKRLLIEYAAPFTVSSLVTLRPVDAACSAAAV